MIKNIKISRVWVPLTQYCTVFSSTLKCESARYGMQCIRPMYVIIPISCFLRNFRVRAWLMDKMDKGIFTTNIFIRNISAISKVVVCEDFPLRKIIFPLSGIRSLWSFLFQLELDEEDGPEPLCRSFSSAHLAERKLNMEATRWPTITYSGLWIGTAEYIIHVQATDRPQQNTQASG